MISKHKMGLYTPWRWLGAVLALELCVCSKVGQLYGESEHDIPVGAIYDATAAEVWSAFSYGIYTTSNSGIRIYVTMDANNQTIPINGNINVATTMCSLMYNGVFVLFGTHDMDTIKPFRSYTNTFHMPYVTTSMPVNVTGQNNGYMFYMRPLYAQAIIDIVKYYRWTKVFYLFDSDEGLFRLQQLFDVILTSETDLEIKVFEVAPSSTVVYEQLAAMDESYQDENKPVLLDLSYDIIGEVLTKQERDPWRLHFHYIPVGLDFRKLDLSVQNYGGIRMTGFQLVDSENERNRPFFDAWGRLDPVDWPGAGGEAITYEAALAIDSARLIFQALDNASTALRPTTRNGTFAWSRGVDCDAEPVVPFEYGTEIMEALRNTEFHGLTGHVRFDNYGLRTNYSMDVLDIDSRGRMNKIGRWTTEGGLASRSPVYVRPYAKGTNIISSRTLIMTSILTEPFLMLRSQYSGSVPYVGNGRFEGYCADLARKISQLLRVDYEIVPVKDGRYGSRDENGSWDGMVGELVRNEADIAIAPLTITSSRERVIDFSKPFMNLGISIMMKKPAMKIPSASFSFLNPFSYEIWMSIFLAYIGTSVVLFLVCRFSPYEWETINDADGSMSTNNFSLSNSFWFSMGCLMQQGYDKRPRSLSGRTAGAVWCFFALLVITSYLSTLIRSTVLGLVQNPFPIQSAYDLGQQTEIKYGTLYGSSIMEFFKTSTIPNYERMWGVMTSADPTVFVSSIEEGVERVRDEGRYAFFLDSKTNDYINSRKPCDTMKVGGNLNSKGYGIATPLGSEIRDRITLAVLELRDYGALEKLEKKWWYEKGECGEFQTQPEEDDVLDRLTLMDVHGLFYVLIAGLVLALIVCALEFLYKTREDARTREHQDVTYIPMSACPDDEKQTQE